MQEKILENHKICLERKEFYKNFGYDIEKEREYIFEKSQPIQGSILEVGTGKGHFALELAKQGHSFTTIDISEQEQEFARLNIEQLGLTKQVNFKIENAHHLSFRDKSFNVIFSINTMHHIDDAFKVVDELIRVLKPKGKIVLSDFNKEGFKLIKKVHKSEGRDHHQGKTTLSDIKDYMRQRNLSTEEYKSDFQDILIVYKN